MTRDAALICRFSRTCKADNAVAALGVDLGKSLAEAPGVAGDQDMHDGILTSPGARALVPVNMVTVCHTFERTLIVLGAIERPGNS